MRNAPPIHGYNHNHNGPDPTQIDWEDVGSGGGNVGGGGTTLLYDYTVTGSPKADIDTFNDGVFAGLLRTDLTYLEIYLTSRTTEAVAMADYQCFFNNDTASSHYTRAYISSTKATGHPDQAFIPNGNTFGGATAGDSAAPNVAGLSRIFIPAYADPYFFKIGEFTNWGLDTTGGLLHYQVTLTGAMWQSTDPINRIMFRPVITGTSTPGPDWAIGTRLSIWAR